MIAYVWTLEQVFQVISDKNLKISVIKYEFFKDSLNFVGFQFNADGVRLLMTKWKLLEHLSYQIKCRTYVDTWVCLVFLGT